MRIVFIVTRADSIGGAQIHIRDLAFRLTEDAHEVTVLSGGEGDLTRMLSSRGIPFRLIGRLVRPISPVKDFLAILETRRLLAELRPDIVSTHTAKAGMVGRAAAWSLGIPCIFTAHGWQFAEGISPLQRFVVETIERATAAMCRKIITVSEYDRRLALERRVVKPDKMITIHNGMPDLPRTPRPPVPRPRAPAGESSFPAEPARLIMTARFQAQKDHATLFRALSGIGDRPWTLELVGDGPDLEACRALAAELGIADRVNFAGQRLDVPERLAKADIFVLASKWEGFPRSILEAMRAGLPVAASDVGGCGESVVEGETGYLVPREDVEALRRRLGELMASPELRRRMGDAGRKRFEEYFTFDAMYARTLAVYREAAGVP